MGSNFVRVSDGTRTRDRLDHNQELYLLSYAHQGPPVGRRSQSSSGFGTLTGVGHTIVIYRASERADAALRDLARAVGERGGALTVLALAVEEPVGRGCCDTRSVLWNRIERELAGENLARARMAVEDAPEVELGILVHSGRRIAEVVKREALRLGADEVVIADPRSCGLSRREQRRLRVPA
jgi:hypothetical protein